MKIGSAKYGGDKKNYYKLKDGESVYRILPPIGDLADEGRWSIYYNVHYGYKNTKGNMRPFQSPLVKNRKTNMIEIPDKALERIEKLKVELEKAKEAKNTDLVERLQKLVGSAKALYNMDSHHYMNVVDTQGNIGILKIRHRAKQALDATIKKLRDAGVDPLSIDNGRFFVFQRSGTGRDTTFQVTVYEQKMNIAGVGEVKKEVVHQLDESIIKRLEKEAAMLNQLFPRPTAEQVARIVTEGAKAVDEILDTKATQDVQVDDGGPDEEETTTAAPAAPAIGGGTTTSAATPGTTVTLNTTQAPAAPAPTAAPVSAAPAPTAAPTTQTQQAAAPATPSPQAAPAPAASTAAAPAPSPTQTTAKALAETSDEDFLKTLNI